MPYHRPIPERRKPGKATPGLQAVVEAEKMAQIAILLPVTALVGWLAGAWLDEKLHQSWMGVTGALVGGVAGLAYAIQMALAAANTSDSQNGETAASETESESARPGQDRGKTE